MTGWRIGFAAGPADVIGGMAKIQSHTTSNACSISQKASLEAFGGPQYEVQRMVSEFQRRRNYALMKLQRRPRDLLLQAAGRVLSLPERQAPTSARKPTACPSATPTAWPITF